MVDGLQRCTQKLAARECGMPLKDMIPARVFFDLDPVEELDLFLALNLNRRSLSQWVISGASSPGASRLR